MIPFLTYPLALIALATLPALAAIYILRNRFRRRQVSSLVLWRFHVQSKAGGSKVHRLQLPLLFFLNSLLSSCSSPPPAVRTGNCRRPHVLSSSCWTIHFPCALCAMVFPRKPAPKNFSKNFTVSSRRLSPGLFLPGRNRVHSVRL